jgi:hypothetical protein
MAENNDEGAEKQTNSTPEKTKLSLMSGIALLIGSIIGSGIFISPRGVLLGTGKFQSHFSFFIHIKIYLYCLIRFLWFISYCMDYLWINLCSRMFMLC